MFDTLIPEKEKYRGLFIFPTMITSILKLLFLLASVHFTVGRLWPYGPNSGDEWMDRETVRTHVEPKSVVFDLPEKITMFDDTDVQKLKVKYLLKYSRKIYYFSLVCNRFNEFMNDCRLYSAMLKPIVRY